MIYVFKNYGKFLIEFHHLMKYRVTKKRNMILQTNFWQKVSPIKVILAQITEELKTLHFLIQGMIQLQ
jgi:hypothetical protein